MTCEPHLTFATIRRVDTTRPEIAAALGHRSALMRWAHAQAPQTGARRDADTPSTPDAVLEAAVGLFARHGFAACTMKDLARAADVQAPALYNHFESKEQILAQAIRRAMSIFLLTVLGPLDAYPVTRWLERVVWAHTTYQVSDTQMRSAHELLIRSENLSSHLRDDDREALLWTQREYVKLMRALIEVANPDMSHSQRTVAAFGIIAMCDRASSWFRPGGPEPSEQVADHMWSLVAAMLGLTDE